MYKIAVMGDKDSISAFASIGVEVFPETEQRSAVKLIRQLAEQEYGVIFITEQLASLIQNEIDKLAERPVPAVILIPGVSGNTGDGLANLSKYVEKAVGSDVLS